MDKIIYTEELRNLDSQSKLERVCSQTQLCQLRCI